MTAGGMAREKLPQRGLDGDDRMEEAVAPLGIADRLTRRQNGLGWEVGGALGLEALQPGGDTGYPERFSCQWGE